jgi:transcription elongation factor GreA
MIKKTRLTQEGFDEKNGELAKLRSERIGAVAELQRAREMGDLSENAAYKVARSKLSGIDRRIRFLEAILKRVQVMQKRTDGSAGIGSNVEIDDGMQRLHVTLVDGYESDIGKGKISLYSPIGRAIFGRRTGDVVEVHTPSGIKKYTVCKIT